MFDEDAVWQTVTKEAESIIQQEYGGNWTVNSQRARQSVEGKSLFASTCTLPATDEDIIHAHDLYSTRSINKRRDEFFWDDLSTLANTDYRDLISALYDNLPENSPDGEEQERVEQRPSAKTIREPEALSTETIEPQVEMSDEEEFSVDAHFLHSQIIPNSHSAGDVFDFIVRNSSTSLSAASLTRSSKIQTMPIKNWSNEQISETETECYSESAGLTAIAKCELVQRNHFDIRKSLNTVKTIVHGYNSLKLTSKNVDTMSKLLSINKDRISLDSFESEKTTGKQATDHDSSYSSVAVATKQADAQNVFKCGICDYSTNSRTQFWRHRKAFDHFSERPITNTVQYCALCKYSTHSRFNMTRHFERVHVAERRVGCEHCEARFKDADTLHKHLAYCRQAPTACGDSVAENACVLCMRHFKTRADLRRHTRLVHEGARDFACNHCGKCFQTGANMRRHIAAGVCAAE